MTGVLDTTEVTPRMRTYYAIQLTEQNIRLIARELIEYVFTGPDGDTRMAVGEESVPLGWWVVWHEGLTNDRNFYSDEEFHAMYEQKATNANR